MQKGPSASSTDFSESMVESAVQKGPSVSSTDFSASMVETPVQKEPSTPSASSLKEKNFQDDDVDCVSENGGKLIEKNRIVRSDSNIQKLGVNFQDDDVECSSESGRGSSSSSYSYASSSSTMTTSKDTLFDRNVDFKLISEILALPRTAESIVYLCDLVDDKRYTPLSTWIFNNRCYHLLVDILKESQEKYLTIVNFLKDRIPRSELPNLQSVELPTKTTKDYPREQVNSRGDIPDCALPKQIYYDNPLDKLLLTLFRGKVQQEVNYKSTVPGIKGLLEEGRHYMLSDEGTPENQHAFVRNTLGWLLTPALPPFYRIFMSGIVPSKERNDPDWLVSLTDSIISSLPDDLKEKVYPGKQLGPWPYAPYLTTVVTPPFLQFLVGPSRANRRVDGSVGDMVVEKCKFLQESGCKGLCLHQCKIPAQEFFSDTLGVPLTVIPNFVTQECQWSWGQEPLPADIDPEFPKNCLSGCPSKAAVQDKSNNLCNA